MVLVLENVFMSKNNNNMILCVQTWCICPKYRWLPYMSKNMAKKKNRYYHGMSKTKSR